MGQLDNAIHLALAVIETEAQAVQQLANNLGPEFTQACELLLNCPGRIVVTGLGKSGHVGSKIAATLASTGTPAFFVHAAEAGHGDMGMITAKDVILAISHSGETQELLQLLPVVKRLGAPLISLTGNTHSQLAQAATVNLAITIDKEACPLGLAPTASTTAALVMGDALAIALLNARGFTADDFALSHPSGSLGKRLLLRVNDLMHSGDAIPQVKQNTPLKQALVEVSSKKLGMTTVVDQQGKLCGIFTDGDLRRALDKNESILTTPIETVMTTAAKTITADLLAASALEIMEQHAITTLVVVDEADKPTGILHLHDLIKAGV